MKNILLIIFIFCSAKCFGQNNCGTNLAAEDFISLAGADDSRIDNILSPCYSVIKNTDPTIYKRVYSVDFNYDKSFTVDTTVVNIMNNGFVSWETTNFLIYLAFKSSLIDRGFSKVKDFASGTLYTRGNLNLLAFDHQNSAGDYVYNILLED